MYSSSRTYHVSSLLFALNRVIMALYRVKVSITLVYGRLRDVFAYLLLGISRRISSPLKAGLAILVISTIAGPTILYLHERSMRIESDKTLRFVSTEMSSENYFLKKTANDLLLERYEMFNLLLDAGYQLYINDKVSVKVLTTGYSSSPFETDDTPFITASNTSTRKGIIALSRDLLRPYTSDAPFSFGDKVYLEGIGEFIVEDVMHGRWSRRADIWFPSRLEALHFGVREAYLSKRLDDLELAEINPRTETTGLIKAGNKAGAASK